MSGSGQTRDSTAANNVDLRPKPFGIYPAPRRARPSTAAGKADAGRRLIHPGPAGTASNRPGIVQSSIQNAVQQTGWFERIRLSGSAVALMRRRRSWVSRGQNAPRIVPRLGEVEVASLGRPRAEGVEDDLEMHPDLFPYFGGGGDADGEQCIVGVDGCKRSVFGARSAQLAAEVP